MSGACKAVVLALAGLMCGCSAAIAEVVPGIYSGLTYHQESGDLLGMEVMLVPSREGWSAVVQVAQGASVTPVVVKAEVQGEKVRFLLPPNESGYDGEFIGHITKEGLEGGFTQGQLAPNGDKVFRLRKGPSYWQFK